MFRMLIVDDDFVHCEGIAHLTKQFFPDMDITLCDDAVKALDLLRREAFHILNVDICMPGISGLDILEQILPEQPELQVIVYSAYSEFQYTKRVMQLGVRHYILKPLRIDEFEETLTSAVAQCAQQAQGKFRDCVRQMYYSGQEMPVPTANRFPFWMALVDLDNRVPQDADVEEQLHHRLGEESNVILLNNNQLACLAPAFDLDQLRKALKEFVGDEFVIISCGQIKDTTGLMDAFAKATELLSYRFYMQNGQVYTHDGALFDSAETAGQKVGLSLAFDCIQSGKYPEAEKAVLAFFSEVSRTHHGSDLYLKSLVSDFFKQLCVARPDLQESSNEYVTQIFSCKSVQALQAVCCEIVHKASEHRDENSGSQIIHRAIEILQAECDKDISLNQLAERTYLSPGYVNLFLNDEVFYISLKNTLLFALITGPLSYLLCFGFAWLVNELGRGLRVLLTFMFYAPSISTLVYFIWQFLFSGDSFGLMI